jgi:hypothetical protein
MLEALCNITVAHYASLADHPDKSQYVDKAQKILEEIRQRYPAEELAQKDAAFLQERIQEARTDVARQM